MVLKDLRPVVEEQTNVDIIVQAGNDSVESGSMLFFSVDKSIDDLEVVEIHPVDDQLIISLKCDPNRLLDSDWDSVFNQPAIMSIQDGAEVTLTQQGE